MKRISWMVLCAAVTAGCIVTPARRQETVVGTRTPECRPSQYWDGTQCRHKGQGYGARKHDSPPR
jgi:hypothetical protein